LSALGLPVGVKVCLFPYQGCTGFRCSLWTWRTVFISRCALFSAYHWVATAHDSA